MLLKAYYTALATSMTGGFGGKFKTYNGTEYTAVWSNNMSTAYYHYQQSISLNKMNQVQTSLYTSSSYPGVCFGTGTTPVSADDYTLSGDIITTLSANISETASSDDNGFVRQFLYTITNSGDTAFTIGEMAYFGPINTSSNNSYAVMYERTVLDSPLTIEPGGVGQVTYTIRLNYPTA